MFRPLRGSGLSSLAPSSTQGMVNHYKRNGESGSVHGVTCKAPEGLRRGAKFGVRWDCVRIAGSWSDEGLQRLHYLKVSADLLPAGALAILLARWVHWQKSAGCSPAFRLFFLGSWQ
jgi:hypothetical protein